MKKISFPEPACRFNCPHFKIVGAMLNETCYCMKKGRKGKQFQKKDIKRRPPDWCPQRLKTSVCRIYGFRDALQESLDLDYRLALKLEKADWCFPMGHRYVLRHEFPLGMTAEKFYAAVQELVVDEVLNGTPVRNGELIEIDDGLAPYFFYVYNQATVFPAKVFGLKKEDHDET